MTKYVALLRAVNVGGTGKLRMLDFVAACRGAGFADIETYIASGNAVFGSKSTASKVKTELESQLQSRLQKKVGVIVRTAAEMRAILRANPFPQADPKLTYAIFLDLPAPSGVLMNVRGRTDEKISLGHREIYVYYPSGMGHSKLKIPAANTGTARNMNTVARLVEMTYRVGKSERPNTRN